MDNQNKAYKRAAMRDADPKNYDSKWCRCGLLVTLTLKRIAAFGPWKG